MTGALNVFDMRANVARSQGHVFKQEIIIARLTEQGHEAMATDARAILVGMHAHLKTEIDILTRMESAAISTFSIRPTR